jgi:alanine dehydrogenase
MIIKVKEPLEPEYSYIKDGQIIFTYLHLAANKELTLNLLNKGVIGIGYETVELGDGSLPLLRVMSEIAGRLSVQIAAFCLEAKNGGRGILIGGATGVPPAKGVILGAGTSGINASMIAIGMGADVTILDINLNRLKYINEIMRGSVKTLFSSTASIEEEVIKSDFVIGAVLIHGSRTPILINRDILKMMKKGAVIIDLSVDQGGCCETTRPTTHSDPIYVVDGVVHYCVANIPAAVPRTSTFSLTNATLPYALEIAEKGIDSAIRDNPAIKRGINVFKGRITCKGVAEAFNMIYEPINI